MKILLTGVNGQLGEELSKTCPKSYQLIKTNRKNLDLSIPEKCYQLVLEIKPDWIINSGAYTAVDNAESDKETAYRVNADAPRGFSEALNKTGGRMLQLSTDFIFSGENTKFHKTTDLPNPINYYGFSKFCGERHVLSNPKNIILRTSWVYGIKGKNFLNTILNLNDKMISLDKNLNIVSDQIGSPTSVKSLANICWRTIDKCTNSESNPSILHWRNSGAISWFDFANAIIDIAYENKIIRKKVKIYPIFTEDYPCPTLRPKFSVLDTSSTENFLGVKTIYWRTELEKILESHQDAIK